MESDHLGLYSKAGSIFIGPLIGSTDNHQLEFDMSEIIIPAAPGLRCVVWPGTGKYWTADSRTKDSPVNAVNRNCWSIIGWSIAGDNPPVPILSNGKFSSLGNPVSPNQIALLHANGAVEWQGQFFADVDSFVAAARTSELNQSNS